jgi:EcsC protein family
MSFEAERAESAPPPPPGLLARLRADPLHAAEHIALAAADVHAPAAARWAGAQRAAGRYRPYTLGEMARKRHSTLASMTGAATGVGGLLTIVPDLVSLAWLQSRMVFFVAAAFGWAPADPMRPAELLALTGLHRDPASARSSLDGLQGTPSVAEHWVGSKLQRDEALTNRLVFMVGKKAGRSIAGRMVPGFAIAYNAVSNRHDTNALGRRAIAFYSPVSTPRSPSR